MTSSLPLFPLGTVLFPGGVLPLRVFEARYVDMIRAAMRDGGTFGVVLIQDGQHEVGNPDVAIADVGCRARIDDWDMAQLGVLQITTTGTERFRIVDRHVKADGLIVADVVAIDDEASAPPPDDAAASVALLKRVVEQIDDEAATLVRPIAKPYRFDDATWVGNRLGELLPMPLPMKQSLMASTDSTARLATIMEFLRLHGVGE
jgi:Lon protease-like protein